MKFIKKIIFLVLLLAGTASFAKGSLWLTDFEEALKQAEAKKLPILADFSGSDWCGWCIKLDQEVFSTTKFQDYAKQNFILFLADFPRGKKQDAKTKEQNSKLVTKYKIQGFPTVLILSPSGELIKKTGYMPGGPDSYIKHLQTIKASIK